MKNPWLALLTLLTLMTLVPPACSRAEDAPDGVEVRPLLFGVNRIGGIPAYPAEDYDEHLYQRIREANGTMVRLLAAPRDIERERGKRDWTAFDIELERALRYGQEPMMLICNTPTWALPAAAARTPGGMEPEPRFPYADEFLPEFEDFCRELAERTQGKIRYFQLWNEQNGISWHFWDGFNIVDDYLPMYEACERGLKAGNPDALLLLGSLDDAEGNGHIFLENSYRFRDENWPDRKPLFRGITTHPYHWNIPDLKEKIDRLRDLCAAHGDDGIPFFVTEYGWHTDGIPEADRVRLVKEYLHMLQQPDMNYVKGSVMLSLAHFEGGPEGFGLCDPNLRPLPAFYAFQGAPRFGASPAHTIHIRPESASTAKVTFHTELPAEATLLSLPPEHTDRIAVTSRGFDSPMGVRHEVLVDSLEPGAVLRYRIQTRTADGKAFDSADFTFTMPSTQVLNGDFEDGFFAGIAHGWTITGEGFCANADLIPGVEMASGKRAQAMFALSDKSQNLDSTARTWVVAQPGAPVRILARAQSVAMHTRAILRARVGIDPAGGEDPEADHVVWGEWKSVGWNWDTLEAETAAQGEIVTVFLQGRAIGSGGVPGVAFDKVEVGVAAE